MSLPNRFIRQQSALLWLLIAFIGCSLLYLWATPPLEASDELWHFGFVDHVANTGELPVQVVGVATQWEQEGSQPPLYYLIGALLVKPIDRGDFDLASQPNPHTQAGIPGAVGNKNLVLHASVHPAPTGTALAVYVLRLFGIACGVVTIAAVYRVARLIAPERGAVALLAAGITAFNPMFLFISASVNNDVLVTALTSLALWQTISLLRDGFGLRRCFAIALLIALAALTKLSGLVIVPVVALAALWVAVRDGNWRGLLIFGGLIAIIGGLVAGWWYLRNLALYGELFGTATMAAVAGVRADPFSLSTLLAEFQGFRFTYWGVFGAVNLMTYRPFYNLMDAISLLAVAGVILALLRRKTWTARFPLLLLALAALIGTAGVIAWTSQTYASQGRLLFPYLAAISPLLAVGLCELLALVGQRVVTILSRALVIAAAVFALIVPVVSIAPEYAPPPALAALPEGAEPVYARFGDVALVGYQTQDRRYRAGEVVPITVYWQVIDDTAQDLSLYLHAVGSDGTVVGRVDSFPGAGSLRTTTWTPGAIYADHYAIPLDETEHPISARLRVQVGWWNATDDDVIAPVDANGDPLDSVMLDAGAIAPVRVQQTILDGKTASADFGGVIGLRGYALDGDSLALAWETLAPPNEDYTVFVQVVNSAGAIVGQGDAPPQMPTHYWRAGDQFVTEHAITYTAPPAAGSYTLLVGWYRPDDFSRLTTDSPDNAYPLAMLTLP